jgi:hypothetical protein
MAFMEQKLQPIDLLGAWQARQQRERMERDSAAAVDPAMDNLRQRMAAEQLKAAELANKRAEIDMQPAVMTVSPAGMPGLTAQGMGSSKQFVSDAPGYMSGVSTTDLMKEKGDTVRATLAAMAASAGGGRGMRGGVEEATIPSSEVNMSKDAKLTIANLAATAEENKTKQGVADRMAELQAKTDAEYGQDRERHKYDMELEALRQKGLADKPNGTPTGGKELDAYIKQGFDLQKKPVENMADNAKMSTKAKEAFKANAQRHYDESVRMYGPNRDWDKFWRQLMSQYSSHYPIPQDNGSSEGMD